MRLKTFLTTILVLVSVQLFLEFRRNQIKAEPHSNNVTVSIPSRTFKIDDLVQVHVKETSDYNLDELNHWSSNAEINTLEVQDYKITARVVEVLPNGKLALKAQKTIKIDGDEVIETSLTGIVSSADVRANDTVLSENISELQIIRRHSAKTNQVEPWQWLLTAMIL